VLQASRGGASPIAVAPVCNDFAERVLGTDVSHYFAPGAQNLMRQLDW